MQKLFICLFLCFLSQPAAALPTSQKEEVIIRELKLPLRLTTGLYEIITPTKNIVYLYKEHDGTVTIAPLPSGLFDKKTWDVMDEMESPPTH